MGGALTFWQVLVVGVFAGAIVTWAVCDVRAAANETKWSIRLADNTTDAFVNGYHKGREARRVATLPPLDRCWTHPGYSNPCPRCEAGH